MSKPKKSANFMEKLAAFIVDKRNLFFLLYVFAIIFCLFSMNWTKVENDITTYLSEDSETRQALEIMNDNFATFGTARVMVNNITYEKAESIAEEIRGIDGVDMVDFNDSTDYYKNTNALFSISFQEATNDSLSIAALEEIKALLEDYNCYYDTLVGYDENAMLQQEMGTILMIGVVIIIIALVLTSRAYMEVPVLLTTFGIAALLNMGTNFILGKISFISDSIAVVLQLALAIDYAIILCHRYSDEHETLPAREAAIIALSKAIPEIASSSLTTISGLLALGFMEFGIGLDMAIVLIKAILLSLLSVFTLMPGLLVLMTPLIDKTKHKKLLPEISAVGKFSVKTRYIIPPLFVLVIIGAFYFSSLCPYCYTYTDLTTSNQSERQEAYQKIKATFGSSNMVAVMVPTGDYEAEQAILEELEACPEVSSTMGLANIEAMDGYMLTDSLTPREFSELIGLDYEVAELLYSAYELDGGEMGQLISGIDNVKIPLFDMFFFLKETMEENGISLEGEMEGIEELFAQLDTAKEQLQSDNYSRMVVYLNLPEESEETFAFLDKIHEIADKYYDGGVYVAGNSTSARDLSASFSTDNMVISILSALFVILILLFTFKSVALPVLLIIVIQGSIWINFAVPTLTDTPLYFLGYLIVNAIQMGANIDYAIVISSHFKEQREHLPAKEAIIIALNKAFPTVITSGTILASTGMLIGMISTQPVTAIMGECIGRGTIISMALVLFVLPGFLVIGDKLVERTSFEMKGIEIATAEATGTMVVKGRVRGYVSGVLDANVDGVLHGRLHAAIATGAAVNVVEEREDIPTEDNFDKSMIVEEIENLEEGGAEHEE